jgi:hypothetical protein
MWIARSVGNGGRRFSPRAKRPQRSLASRRVDPILQRTSECKTSAHTTVERSNVQEPEREERDLRS